jgi:MFS family permease
VSEEFQLRSIAVAAYGPATLFGLAEGAMMPVIALSAIDRGASTSIAALIAALLAIGSIVTNIPSGILATRIGERKSMIVAAIATVIGLAFCLVDIGHGTWSLLVYGFGILIIGSASSVYSLARQSYLTEMVPPHMRARALSTLGGTLRIGMFIGPFLGAGATALWGLPGAYYVSLVSIVAAGVIVYRVPDLEMSEEHKAAAAQVTSWGIVREYRRTFLTLGTGILLLSAIRQSRQVVIPLWAAHIGLSPTADSIIYGIAGAIDALTFYPAGKVMDVYGRRWVAVPCVIILGISFVLMPLTHGAVTLALTAMLMGFGNGIGSGIVMTLGADISPAIGRPTFLGIWRELADAGSGVGPVILSAVTAVAGLGSGIVVSGIVGFAAAAALWVWTPKHHGTIHGRQEAGAADTLARLTMPAQDEPPDTQSGQTGHTTGHTTGHERLAGLTTRQLPRQPAHRVSQLPPAARPTAGHRRRPIQLALILQRGEPARISACASNSGSLNAASSCPRPCRRLRG